MKARIYHNPRCSKSRAALALLEARGVDLTVIDYLRAPPSKTTLRALLRKLDGAPIDLIRVNDAEYRAAVPAGHAPTDEELLDLLVRKPALLQRPIVEIGAQARIGRPPERVLELIE
jgi:arsenate reductase (glutaredoxin)